MTYFCRASDAFRIGPKCFARAERPATAKTLAQHAQVGFAHQPKQRRMRLRHRYMQIESISKLATPQIEGTLYLQIYPQRLDDARRHTQNYATSTGKTLELAVDYVEICQGVWRLSIAREGAIHLILRATDWISEMLPFINRSKYELKAGL